MIRMLINVGLTLLANALGLIVAAWALDDMTLTFGALIIAVVIFTVVYALAQPFLTQMAISRAPRLRGGVALVATLVALIITSLLTDNLSISGGLTWVEASVIVWLVSLIGAWLLPILIVKEKVQEKRG
ncbi:phage holin family protein [Nocardioides mangrovi]|uniref:Phage holin family protein n=1 Tax=Nocardioides mangrovi TaxID=2874580 RepID=A0ABS7UHF0_9ACTN|nr:phage holin family protein [Nocardioides mangrovi]MBZ5740250.1 phage holin family protein [Nocardioides mangrovi]